MLLISCTWGGPVSFGLFFAAVQAVMLKEFYRIMRAAGYKPLALLGIVSGVLIFAFFWYQFFWIGFFFEKNASVGAFGNTSFANAAETSYYNPIRGWEFITLRVLLTVVVLSFVSLLYELSAWPKSSQPFANIGAALGGIFYVSIPMALLNVIAFGANSFEPRRIFFLIFLVWSADTGAYFAGKNFGKHKLAPSISPGKTWEGWAGGAILTLIVAASVGYFLPTIPLGHRLVAGAVVAVFGPLGDLAESMLKRSAGVKDSGTFLPGHGGLLDRFDAFLLVLPVLALLQVLAG
ncbi:MAG: phosphatidate cytidylyltransferase [Janthinobacterium lividum]